MFKRFINVPDGCVTFINGVKIENDNIRKLKADKKDYFFFVCLQSETFRIKCSAETADQIPVTAEMRIALNVKANDEQILKWAKTWGLAREKILGVKQAKDAVEENIGGLFSEFAKGKEFLELRKESQTYDFRKRIEHILFEWIEIELRSLDISLNYNKEDKDQIAFLEKSIADEKIKKLLSGIGALEMENAREMRKNEMEHARKMKKEEMEEAESVKSKNVHYALLDMEQKRERQLKENAATDKARENEEELAKAKHQFEIEQLSQKARIEREKLAKQNQRENEEADIKLREKQIDVLKKEKEIESKNYTEYSRLLASLKGLTMPDYTGVNTVVHNANGSEKSELIEPVISAVLTNFLNTEGKALLKTGKPA